MRRSKTLPREGDLYRVFSVGGHSFPVRYGYYEESERGRVEPLPVFPDLVKEPFYTEAGTPVTALIQSACGHYLPRQAQYPEHWCGDCFHYDGGKAEMGICQCPERKRE